MAFNKRDWANGERITEGLLDDLEQRIETGLAEVPIEVTDPLVSTLVDDDFSTTTSSIKARVEGWVADGTIPTAEPAALTVTETQPGAYALESGSTSATIYGLTESQLLPPAAESKLAADLGNSATATGGAVSSVVSSAESRVRGDLTPSNNGRPVGKGELVLNVRDFGAKGDGVTDDTAAINAALAALPSASLGNTYGLNPRPMGGTLLFPSGRYLTGPLELGHYVRFLGDGQGSTVIQLKAGANAPLIQNVAAQRPSNGGGGTHGIVLENLRLNGNKTQQTVVAPVIRFEALWNQPAIINCIVSDGSGDGLRIHLCDNLRVDRSEFIHNAGWGVYLDGVYNPLLQTCLVNFNASGGVAFKWADNMRALASNAHHSKTWTSAGIKDSYFEKNQGSQVLLDGVQGIRLRDSQMHTSDAAGAPRVSVTNGSRSCEITGNTFTGDAGDDAALIFLDGSTSEIFVSLLGTEALVKTGGTTRRRGWVQNLAGAANVVFDRVGSTPSTRLGSAGGVLIGNSVELLTSPVTNYVRSSHDLTASVWPKYNGLTAALTSATDPWGNTVDVTRLTFMQNNFDYTAGTIQGAAPVAGEWWTMTVWARAVGDSPRRFRLGISNNTSADLTLEDLTFQPGEFRPYTVSHRFKNSYPTGTIQARVYNIENAPVSGEQLDVLAVVVSRDARAHLPIRTTASAVATAPRGLRSFVPVETSALAGVVLPSPNGTRYRLTVDDTGVLSTVAA